MILKRGYMSERLCCYEQPTVRRVFPPLCG